MLAELFKTEERAKILRYVLFHSSFSVSEVAKATGVNKGLVSSYLRLLEKLRLLRRADRKYTLLDSSLTRASRLLLNLEKLDPSTLSMGSFKGLGLYGSWARGTNRSDSDVDFWISADTLPGEEKLARLQRDLSLRTGAEVNLLVITPQKLAELKLNDPPFYNSLIMNSLTVKGEPLEDSG